MDVYCHDDEIEYWIYFKKKSGNYNEITALGWVWITQKRLTGCLFFATINELKL